MTCECDVCFPLVIRAISLCGMDTDVVLMSELTNADSNIGDGVEVSFDADQDDDDGDSETPRKRRRIEVLNSLFDDDNQIDDIKEVTLVHRAESGAWEIAVRSSDVSEETKADALEALAVELRQKRE